MALDSARQLQPDTVMIPASQPPELALREGQGAERIDIQFDSFKDGRGFSLAAMLRAQGFAGVLRAVGPLLPDQEEALKRVGFDEVISDRSHRPWRGCARIPSTDLDGAKGQSRSVGPGVGRGVAARNSHPGA